MQDFHPKEIYVDAAVIDSPVTRRILAKYPGLPVTEIADKSAIKFPQDHGRAKRRLYVSRYEGDPVKSCQGMGDYVCCQYFTIALVSDCHLECTYCILQDYLRNNPVITVYANVDEIFARIRERVVKHPNRIFRIGTGELSDSLALDHITEFSREVASFAAENPNVLIELKTKTANVDNLIGLDHRKRVVVSWSLNPQGYIDSEEHKCDSLAARLEAARRCADAGYPVGIHFDPLLNFDGWETEYAGLVDAVASTLKPEEIAWVSIGSLRFTKDLKKISQERFPKSALMSGELLPSQDGKMRYFRPLREEMYAAMKTLVETRLGRVPHYLCMETKAVWRNVYGEQPSNATLEGRLTRNFQDAGRAGFTV
jgi:spore photoproduct lyase